MAEVEALKDDVVALTARAELAEETAARAWREFHDFYERVAKRAGEEDFAERRKVIRAERDKAVAAVEQWKRQ